MAYKVIYLLFSAAGSVSNEGHFPYTKDEMNQKYLSLGPLVRYAEDLTLVMKILTAKCDHDLRLDEPVDLKQLKVYYRQGIDKTCGVLSMAPEIKQCILKAADHFSQLGAHAEKVRYVRDTRFISRACRKHTERDAI